MRFSKRRPFCRNVDRHLDISTFLPLRPSAPEPLLGRCRLDDERPPALFFFGVDVTPGTHMFVALARIQLRTGLFNHTRDVSLPSHRIRLARLMSIARGLKSQRGDFYVRSPYDLPQ